MKFDDKWEDLGGQLLSKLQLPDDTPIPTPADVAGGIGAWRPEPGDPDAVWERASWAPNACAECGRRMDELGNRLVAQAVVFLRPEGRANIEFLPSREWYALWIACQGVGPVEERIEEVYISGFRAVHEAWERLTDKLRDGLKHPLAALIEGCLIGDPVEADGRETGILPATLAAVREADGPAALFDLGEYERAPGFTPHPIAQAYLPGLAPSGDEIAPAMPLLMWDASTEGGPRPGKAAPLPLRIWIEAVLALPTADRFGIRRPVAVRFGDLVDWLMPNGEYRQRVFPAIRQALHRVHNLRLPWELPDGTGGSRAVVVVRDAPRVWNAYADMVTFEISLPPGVNARGPIVYRPALRRLGQQSAMRYRANLGLSWLWDRYGARNGRYIQPTRPRIARDDQDRILDAEGAILLDKRGEPARTYTVRARRNGKTVRIARPGIVPLDADGRPVPMLADAAHERNPAADRYPVLTPAQLVELCYPLDLAGKQLTPTARRVRQHRAQEAIRLMATEGYCIVEDADGGFRILPPSGWGADYGG